MIVATLLLIPVAVLFLALGIVNGSSSLLITSIVVSLLAAVALVIGLRQAAARRAAESSAAPAARVSRTGRRDPEFDDLDPPPPPAPAIFDEPVAFADDSAPAPTVSAGESGSYERAGVDEARAAGARDAATRLGDREPVPADYADSDSMVDSPRTAARATDPDEHAWRPATAAEADEFDEPDDDDPDDEPLPQSVRPADAVLVARFDTEVLVVDGRPRYHMADCPHLVGRLTEPLPVNEAVELGFSPCGLCRPVDRLVAAVAHQR
ncbi:hypothetical protein [Actinoplanes utahensis]|uniref:hypothetical protein n=1 Tax=Actinoplanes utahensis TaxID=1869 RepID=UPI0005BBAED1|nr:hypothetical protein [Actinoplanes utahensis]GIF34619.1 hypothetical protein Aut01nite_76050 [Actinoplanes utahensis]